MTEQRTALERLRLELEDEREAKEKWRARFLETAKEVDAMNRNPYVAVLIDGDGMIFTEQLLMAGGPAAAAAVLKHARNIAADSPFLSSTSANSFEVLIRIFANVNGLSEALRRRLPNVNFSFRDFTIGFSQPRSLVDWIDVGAGKEMADAKITGEIHFHLRNQNCKMLLLGVSHDNGYARVLSSLVADGVDERRVMLLEGTPFAKEFKALPFVTVKMPEVFLGSKVETQAPKTHQYQQQQQVPDVPPPPYNLTTLQYNYAPHTPPPTNPKPTNRPAPPQPKQRQGTIYPPPLPRPRAAALQRVSSIKPSPCYAHYLADNPCHAGNNCSFNHSITFTSDEFAALKFLAQGLRCHAGLNCTNPKCYWGHRCQVEGKCSGEKCLFKPEEHKKGQYTGSVSNNPSSGGGSKGSHNPSSGGGSKGSHNPSSDGGSKGSHNPSSGGGSKGSHKQSSGGGGSKGSHKQSSEVGSGNKQVRTKCLPAHHTSPL
ncbi:hypothetical protein BDZ91DRAFT_757916 [Kalaharituber pfeilii]|nr:hypothetical protein BDZ91DRAFT_757916 [Kalaharituber pfeilii]